jgi:hypothetical protein
MFLEVDNESYSSGAACWIRPVIAIAIEIIEIEMGEYERLARFELILE